MAVSETVFSVNVPVTGLHRQASVQSGKDTELLYGQLFRVENYRGGWAQGQAISPIINSPFVGYAGYVRKGALAPARAANYRVKILQAPVFVKMDVKSQVRHILPLNACLQVAHKHEHFLALANGGYVHESHAETLEAYLYEPDFVRIAEWHLGLPYVWGGLSPLGVDCSGLVLSALRAVGRDAPHSSTEQASGLGQPLQCDTDLVRGDLVFWPGHVGIMCSDDELLHASGFHMRVICEPLLEACTRIKMKGGVDIQIRRRLMMRI